MGRANKSRKADGRNENTAVHARLLRRKSVAASRDFRNQSAHVRIDCLGDGRQHSLDAANSSFSGTEISGLHISRNQSDKEHIGGRVKSTGRVGNE